MDVAAISQLQPLGKLPRSRETNGMVASMRSPEKQNIIRRPAIEHPDDLFKSIATRHLGGAPARRRIQSQAGKALVNVRAYINGTLREGRRRACASSSSRWIT
mmetsp:Transcript_19570/g.77956  ORF Transcript_19570/g.77956 Transcript_19570/m.77956 type:complete len:103 (-) Transcript_19570:456-764(-)